MGRAHQSGFSLIETLVAATIMFSVLVSAFLAFQASITASAKAETRIELLTSVPRVRVSVTEAIRSNEELSGAGTLGGVSYEWKANAVTQGVALDLDAAGDTKSGFLERKFNLWRVAVRLEQDSSEREFSFTEITWEK